MVIREQASLRQITKQRQQISQRGRNIVHRYALVQPERAATSNVDLSSLPFFWCRMLALRARSRLHVRTHTPEGRVRARDPPRAPQARSRFRKTRAYGESARDGLSDSEDFGWTDVFTRSGPHTECPGLTPPFANVSFRESR